MKENINFFTENTDYRIRGKKKLNTWIGGVIRKEKKRQGAINIIFCDDDFLKRLNKKYLKRNTLTDIITFSQNEGNFISGDLYISLDRIRENAKIFRVPIKEELARVMVHGVLHLTGYDDHTQREAEEMREREDFYLTRLKNLP